MKEKFKNINPIKFTLDLYTCILLISLVINFFTANEREAAAWLADLYTKILPMCVGGFELNRWLGKPKKERPPKLIEGEIYVALWTITCILLVFIQVILPEHFPAKPEQLLGLTSWIWGVFLFSNGSKRFHQQKNPKKENSEE